MKKRLLITVLTGWLIVAGTSLVGVAAATGDSVATVNGQTISRATYDRELNGFLRRMAQSGRQPSSISMDQLRQRVVNNLITGELLYQESKRLALAADTAEVDAQVTKFRSQFNDLAKLNEAMTKAGLTDAGLRDIITRQASIRKLINREIAEKIQISDEAAKTYYGDHQDLFDRPAGVRASHILIKVAADDTAEMRQTARNRADDVRKKALAGSDFAELAREYSEGPSKSSGGDLGFFTRGQMVAPFAEAAFSLAPGEISEVVETRFGYHVIRVAEKRPGGTAPYDEVSESITARLRQEEMNRRLKTYVESLKEKADITISIPEA
jgi:peptidyl-prolyl cis-trans isomerase C